MPMSLSQTIVADTPQTEGIHHVTHDAFGDQNPESRQQIARCLVPGATSSRLVTGLRNGEIFVLHL